MYKFDNKYFGLKKILVIYHYHIFNYFSIDLIIYIVNGENNYY